MSITHTHCIIAQDGDWGRGITVDDAVKAMPYGVNMHKRALYFRCTENTRVDGYGSVRYPVDDAAPETPQSVRLRKRNGIVELA